MRPLQQQQQLGQQQQQIQQLLLSYNKKKTRKQRKNYTARINETQMKSATCRVHGEKYTLRIDVSKENRVPAVAGSTPTPHMQQIHYATKIQVQ